MRPNSKAAELLDYILSAASYLLLLTLLFIISSSTLKQKQGGTFEHLLWDRVAIWLLSDQGRVKTWLKHYAEQRQRQQQHNQLNVFLPFSKEKEYLAYLFGAIQRSLAPKRAPVQFPHWNGFKFLPFAFQSFPKWLRGTSRALKQLVERCGTWVRFLFLHTLPL